MHNERGGERPKLTRRQLIATGVVVVGGYALPRFFRGDKNPPTGSEYRSIPPKKDLEKTVLNPEVHIRQQPGKKLRESSPNSIQKDSETELTMEQKLRLNAPVFTLIHTISDGESLDTLASRYYDKRLVDSGVAKNALREANQSITSSDGPIKPNYKIFIPVAEPVVVKAEGNNPLVQASKKYGFSVSSIKEINADEGKSGYVYLPVQAMPVLDEKEKLYVITSNDKNYYRISTTRGFDLPTLLGRNRPDAAQLEAGHILIASNKSDAPKISPPKTDKPKKEPKPNVATTATPTTSVQENPNQGQSVEALKKQRTWKGEIDGSIESAKLEQQITIEQIKGIKLTLEGYDRFVKSINADYAGVFERAKTVHPAGIIDHPEHFLLHHTAYGYKSGKEGVLQFIQSVINNKLSIQWMIDRDGAVYQLVTDPKIACNQALGSNSNSTGVEIMTDATKAQGSLTDKQLETAMYLALYVNKEVYKNTPDQLAKTIVGHRDINDQMKAGTLGKPDFFTNVLEQAVHPKLRELASQLQ